MDDSKVDRLIDSQDRVGMNQWMDGFEVIASFVYA